MKKQANKAKTLRALEAKLARQLGAEVALTEEELQRVVGGWKLKAGCDASTP